MKHWRTTLFGVVQGVGWVMVGIALYADLAGLPKSYALAHTGLIGCITVGIGAVLHGYHSFDKNHPCDKKPT